ncbi:hypothetical protein GWK08_09660 [Leptobacterium flavescens]|uniref:Uncharacterized protein n=1 Tax=Leptobacterium flavescens TaxID=472055 RepID=A0A6P0UKF1_9FLAO|nr:DUF6155 family protein [Leptobacterium flavescens]NER13704.1 hypothetical protein [Leptobacterium flavescens]
MSKRALVKYLKELDKEQLEEQLIDLYDRFKEVKTYYNFVFNPKEEKLIGECKLKISNEYYPQGKRKRPKMRRSVAQKYIKHFMSIGVDAPLIADVMLFNIEIAQSYSAEKPVKQEAFYTSMYKSFRQAVEFIIHNGILEAYRPRIIKIYEETQKQNWMNDQEFEHLVDMIEELN